MLFDLCVVVKGSLVVSQPGLLAEIVAYLSRPLGSQASQPSFASCLSRGSRMKTFRTSSAPGFQQQLSLCNPTVTLWKDPEGLPPAAVLVGGSH